MPARVRNEDIDLVAINLPGFGFFFLTSWLYYLITLLGYMHTACKKIQHKNPESCYRLLYIVFSRHYPTSEQLQIIIVFS